MNTGYRDGTNDWYMRVGPLLIQTMLIQALMPIYNVVFNYSVYSLRSAMDQGFCKKCRKKENVKATNKKTI